MKNDLQQNSQGMKRIRKGSAMEYREEMSCGNATIQIQVISREKIEGFLADLSFLNYRLANIERRKRDIDQKRRSSVRGGSSTIYSTDRSQ